MDIEKILHQIGFSKNESKVYLASLEAGCASIQTIARRAQIPRTSAYSIVDRLIVFGVIAKTLKNKKVRYVAEPPSRLVSLLEASMRELKAKLPELDAIYNAGASKPKILFYEGKDSVQKVYDDTLVVKPDIIYEWNTESYFNFDKYDVDPAYISKRMKLGIKARRIAGEGSTWDMKHKKYDKSELSETRIVPSKLFWPGVEVNIYGDKVAFLNYADNTSIIIENRAIAETMKQVYELSWRGAGTFDTKF